MSESGLTDDVRKFLRDKIESYEELEIMLFLRRQDAVRTSEEIATLLHTSPETTVDSLRRLGDAGAVVAVDDGRQVGFRYAPSTTELRMTLDRLAAAYEEQRLEVMKLLGAGAIDRVRRGVARAFADAFVWRRRRRDG